MSLTTAVDLGADKLWRGVAHVQESFSLRHGFDVPELTRLHGTAHANANEVRNEERNEG